MASAARARGKRVFGVLLTGMGDDGAEGMLAGPQAGRPHGGRERGDLRGLRHAARGPPARRRLPPAAAAQICRLFFGELSQMKPGDNQGEHREARARAFRPALRISHKQLRICLVFASHPPLPLLWFYAATMSEDADLAHRQSCGNTFAERAQSAVGGRRPRRGCVHSAIPAARPPARWRLRSIARSPIWGAWRRPAAPAARWAILLGTTEGLATVSDSWNQFGRKDDQKAREEPTRASSPSIEGLLRQVGLVSNLVRDSGSPSCSTCPRPPSTDCRPLPGSIEQIATEAASGRRAAQRGRAAAARCGPWLGALDEAGR